MPDESTPWPPPPSVAPAPVADAVAAAAGQERRSALFGVISLVLLAAPGLLLIGIIAYAAGHPLHTAAQAMWVGFAAISTTLFPALGLLFGILGRRSTAGKVGIVLSALGVVLILALLVVAYLVGMHRIALGGHTVTVHSQLIARPRP